MSSPSTHNVPSGGILFDEKHVFDKEVNVSISDSIDGDEALKLVGKERSSHFSDEYNAKLRRKLVSKLTSLNLHPMTKIHLQDWVIAPLCGAVYFTQYMDKTALNYARFFNS